MGQDKESRVENAICGGCQTRTVVWITESGLRCADCTSESPAPHRTYFPSLYTKQERDARNINANITEFKENLDDIGFDIELQDGTRYEMDKLEAHAVFMKYGEDWQAFVHALASKVAEHYEKETEPTKLQEYAPWGSSTHTASQNTYETHAELAPVITYYQLRSALMQLELMAAADPGDDPPSIIGIDDLGNVHQYTENGRITVEFETDGEEV